MVLVKIVLFFVFALVVGLGANRLFCWMIRQQQGRNMRRYPVLAFVLCLVMAYCAEEFFGVADITGAYIAGLILSKTPKITYLKNRFETLSYILLSPIFFASIGLKVELPQMSGSIILFAVLLMVIAILTIPITNALGGNQNAWIKYGFIMALLVLLMLSICYMNGRKAKLVDEVSENDSQDEEEAIPLKKSIPMLFKNKYWVILILFNLITQITNSIAATSGTYYCKWIFGNDNLVALAGALGFFATLVGFVVSKPIIAKLGVRKTIDFGVLGAAFTALIRCIIPTNFKVYIAVSVIGSFVQIPLMCLYGVLLAMVIDYNEYTYYNKMVGVSSGAIGIGTKIGSGVGSVILTACLALGAYNPDLEVATTSMRYAIYAFSNYLPLIINLGLFVLFRFFDLEEKLPAIHEELARRRSQKSTEQ